jgi:Cupin domain
MTIKDVPPMSWTFMESRMHPGHAPPLHLHIDEDEAFYILEGAMRFRCGDAEFDAVAGDFVFVPRGTPHAFRVGEAGVVALQVGTGRSLGDFIEAAGEPAGGPGLPPAGMIDHAGIAREAAAHDMVVVGPPLD